MNYLEFVVMPNLSAGAESRHVLLAGRVDPRHGLVDARCSGGCHRRCRGGHVQFRHGPKKSMAIVDVLEQK